VQIGASLRAEIALDPYQQPSPLAAAKAPGKRLGTPDPAGAVKRASEALRGEKLLSFHFVGLGI